MDMSDDEEEDKEIQRKLDRCFSDQKPFLVNSQDFTGFDNLIFTMGSDIGRMVMEKEKWTAFLVCLCRMGDRFRC
jgi:hypothetical protein